MTKELKEEIEYRVNAKRESENNGEWDEGETYTDAELEIQSLEDLVSLGTDYGGHFDLKGIWPTFVGPPDVVREAYAAQAAYIADIEKQRAAWNKLRNEAMRELRKRRSNENESERSSFCKTGNN